MKTRLFLPLEQPCFVFGESMAPFSAFLAKNVPNRESIGRIFCKINVFA